MERAIVFGANGYLGRHLIKYLQEIGTHVLAYGNRETSRDNIIDYQRIDITNADQVNKVDFNVDQVYLFAGKTGTLDGFDNARSYVNINEMGLLNVLNSIKNLKKKPTLVFPSSRLVYKGVENAMLTEDAEKEAKTIYAANKIACEHYIQAYANQFSIPYIIVRICVPYGNNFDDSYSYGTIGFFLSKALKGQNITLYGDGTLRRTFTHVDDIVSSIHGLIDNPIAINATYNIGSNDNISLLDVAKLIADKFKVGIEFVQWPSHALSIESGDTMFDDQLINAILLDGYKWKLNEWLEGFKN